MDYNTELPYIKNNKNSDAHDGIHTECCLLQTGISGISSNKWRRICRAAARQK